MKKVLGALLILLSLKSNLISQWSQQTSGTSEYLTTVYFASENVGYISGGMQTVLKTVNGENSWQAININLFPGEEMSCIYFLNENTGWVSTGWICGSGGTVVKMTNGGAV